MTVSKHFFLRNKILIFSQAVLMSHIHDSSKKLHLMDLDTYDYLRLF